MATYLDGILAWHRARVAGDSRDVARLIEDATKRGGVRQFSGALRRRGAERVAGGDAHPVVIAEVKRRSPSKGQLAAQFDAGEVAAAYERGGAACLSVLTDREFFGGSPDDLETARAATMLPVLRKDFLICEADVCDARLMGADCVLLIAAVLDDVVLGRLMSLAGALGMDALLEVHDDAEADRAVQAGASLIGVNQRDLTTFEVDPARAEAVAARLPATVLKVAESGISSERDAKRLGRVGYDAVLVGEALVRSGDREEAVRRFRGGEAARTRLSGAEPGPQSARVNR